MTQSQADVRADSKGKVKADANDANDANYATNANIANKAKAVRAKTRKAELTLADRLRHMRLQLGMTQAELAARVHSSQAVIQKIENGKSLRPRIIEDVAQTLGVSAAWLVYGSGHASDLESDAVEVALCWESLPEPQRTAIKSAIIDMARKPPDPDLDS